MSTGLKWRPGRWRIRCRRSYRGASAWAVTFPFTVLGVPRVEWRSTFEAAIALVDEATRERWPGA